MKEYRYIAIDNILHDKSCEVVQDLDNIEIHKIKRFRKNEEVHKHLLCNKCLKSILIRYLFGNTNFERFIEIFNKEKVSTSLLKSIILSEEFCLEWRNSKPELLITYKEDSWVLKVSKDNKVILYHNDYIITYDNQRFIKNSFHKQFDKKLNWSDALKEIYNYDFKSYHTTKN